MTRLPAYPKVSTQVGYLKTPGLGEDYKAFTCLRFARVSSYLLGTVIGSVSFHGISAIYVYPMSLC